jgi:hypothetical protein
MCCAVNFYNGGVVTLGLAPGIDLATHKLQSPHAGMITIRPHRMSMFPILFLKAMIFYSYLLPKIGSYNTMGDHGFILIDSGIPGDRDALFFFEEKKTTFFPLF